MTTTNRAKRLYEICQELRPIQLQFLAARVVEPTDVKAAEQVGIAVSTVYNWPEKTIIDEAVGLATDNAILVVMREMQLVAQQAFTEMVSLMVGAKSEAVKLRACQDILNRAGVTPEAAARAFEPGDSSDGDLSDDERAEMITNLFESLSGGRRITD